MKKVALMAICLGSLGLLACGGGDNGPDVMITDAAPGGNADAGQAACNPVANTGCPAGQKCTSIVEATEPDLLTRTGCAPDGAVAIGGTCARDMATGVDDCVGGSWCIGGTCEEICSQAPDNCPSDKTCVGFVGLFEDQENTGVCQPACSPSTRVADCGTDESCYVILSSGKGSCAPPAGGLLTTGTECGGTPGTQGCDCQFLNGCEIGYGCMLNNAPTNATGLVCTFFCDPLPAGTGPKCGDSIAGGSDVDGPGPSFSCRQVMTFYSNAENMPADVGMCINPSTYVTCAGCADEAQPSCAMDMFPCCDDGTITPTDPSDDCP